MPIFSQGSYRLRAVRLASDGPATLDVQLHRDWVDWALALAAILGGFASLAAVIVALSALRVARADLAAAQRQQQWQFTSHRLDALRRIWLLLGDSSGACIARNVVAVRAYLTQIQILLVTADLREKLPRVSTLVELEGFDDAWLKRVHAEGWAGIKEVIEALEAEAAADPIHRPSG